MFMLIVDFFNVACVNMFSRFCGRVEGVSELMLVVHGLLCMQVDLGGCCDGGLGGGLEMVAGMVFLLCGVNVCDFGACDGV